MLAPQRPSALSGFALHEIDDDVDSVIANGLLYRCREVFLLMIDRELGTEFSAKRQLVGAPCDGDHPASRRHAKLDGRGRNPARRAEHQYGLPALHLAPAVNRVIGRV